jgi:hypothetical protein
MTPRDSDSTESSAAITVPASPSKLTTSIHSIIKSSSSCSCAGCIKTQAYGSRRLPSMCPAQNEPASDCCIHVERNDIVSKVNMIYDQSFQPGTRTPSFRLRLSQLGQCLLVCTRTNMRIARSTASFSTLLHASNRIQIDKITVY